MRGRLTCELGQVLDAAGRLEEALELHRQAVGMLEATSTGRPSDDPCSPTRTTGSVTC